MFRFHRRVADLQDLIIVGGGGAATAALIATIEQQRQQYPNGVATPLTITILERASHVGNGFPFRYAAT